MTAPSNPQTLIGVIDIKTAEDKPEPNSISAWCSSKWKAIVAELISTMLLILLGCMSCIPVLGLTEQSPLYGPLGFGLTVMFNIQIFGHISGAHMNPAVTVASIIWGSTSIALGIAYVIVQCLGAIIGYGILITLAPIDLVGQGICVTMPHPGNNVVQVLGIEIALTAVLSFINCALWDPINKLKQDSVPIKFGLAIAGLSIAGGPLTGASMNPARSLGPAVWTGMWYAHWTYWAGPFIGGTLAALFYKFVFYTRDVTN